MPTYPTAFGAFCEPCEWVGPGRSDNLRALRDYDAHLLTKGHAEARKPGIPEPGDLIVGTFDVIHIPQLVIVELFDGDGGFGNFEVVDQNGDHWGVEAASEPHEWIAV
jgi:hypothetical protein